MGGSGVAGNNGGGGKMKKRLLIIGARGFGRECVDMLRAEFNGFSEHYELAGFLDGEANVLDGYNGYPPIVSSVDDYAICKDDCFLCALGSGEWRRFYAEKILSKGGRFETFVHPTAIVRMSARIGHGVIIGPFTSVSSCVSVGDFSVIHGGCILGHDVRLGDYGTLESQVFCGGGVCVETMATVHTRATLIPKVRIGEGAVVGAGSVVLRHVPPRTTVFGNPAKRVSF